jgi:hypothetical protein
MQKGFFASLFDTSFTSLITTKIVKALYILSMVLIGIGALVLIIAAFAAKPAVGVIVLVVVAPIYVLVYLIWTRVFLELVIVLFRIMENTQALVEQGRGLANAPAPSGPVDPPTSV